MNPAIIYPESDKLLANVALRAGETKIGHEVKMADEHTDLDQTPCYFALIGIPEDIGPRANLGRGGADGAWEAFLHYFLNLQSNVLMQGRDILLLGEVDCRDLMLASANETSPEVLRQYCAELDERVENVLATVFASGLIPIVIGGGHNNAYPIIKACSQIKGSPIAAANLDPHSDFRAMEGRHSGNPFHYAHHSGHLARYAVLGLHEQKNNQASLDAMNASEFIWYTIQQTHWQKSHHYDQCLEQVAKYLLESGLPIGAELDLDAISHIPSSAITAAGLPLNDAMYYVDQMGRLPNIAYLHVAEGAPSLSAQGLQEGERIVGQTVAELVSIFIKSCHQSWHRDS